jgi:hypothetical protein
MAAAGVGAFACKRVGDAPKLITDASTDAGAPGPKASAFVFGGDATLEEASWTSSGEVLAKASSVLLRFPPRKDAPARILRAPDGERWMLVAAAANADVIVATTSAGALVVYEGNGPPRRLGTWDDPNLLRVSPDGKHVALATNGAALTVDLVELAHGAKVGSIVVTGTYARDASFDPTGRFVAVTHPPSGETGGQERPRTVVRAVDPTVPELGVDDGELLGWAPRRLLSQSASAIVITDLATRSSKRVAACAASMSWVDVVVPRVVRVCAGRVDVVDVARGTRTTIASARIPRDGRVTWIAAARASEDLFFETAEGVWRLDSTARTVTARDELKPPMRDGSGAALETDEEAEVASCVACKRSPDGKHWLRADLNGRGWPLEIHAGAPRTGSPPVMWGPAADLRPWATAARPNGRGLDFEFEVDHGTETRARVRLGPAAPLLPDPPAVPEGRASREDCPVDRHVSLPAGELWFRGPDTWSVSNACLCSDYTCLPGFGPSHLGVVDARENAIVVAQPDVFATAVEVLGPDAGVRASVRVDSFCQGGRLAADGRALALLCTRGPRIDVDGGTTPASAELVELETSSGATLRRTPLGAELRAVRGVEASGRSAYVLGTLRSDHATWHVVAPRSGAALARIDAFTDRQGFRHALVARFPDGRVQLEGDEEVASRALACEQDGVLRPFATCQDAVRAPGRFALDL